MILADLKITHCPACDQAVSQSGPDHTHCFLCHQDLQEEPLGEELGAVRLRYERDRLTGELQEADGLLDVLGRNAPKRLESEISAVAEDCGCRR